ncbi:MAG TPA: hypothetical protein VGK74_03740 [Symbiobacteriaceae bacterium]|jgi:hypothetical protein
MGKLHYIWWGPCNEKAKGLATQGPLSAARQLKGHEIFFWCKSDVRDAFAELLPGITVKSCSSVRGIVGEDLYGADTALCDDAQGVLETLNTLKAPSACKDLVSLFILFAQGGLYLDTTSTVTDSSALAIVLSNPPKVPTVPRVLRDPKSQSNPSNWWFHAVFPTITLKNTTFPDSVQIITQVEKCPDSLLVPLIDVWAIYAPAGHAAVGLMARSYVRRAQGVGLYPGMPLISGYKRDDSAKTMEDLIGRIIIHAAYDGLFVMLFGGEKPPKKDAEVDLTGMTWEGKKVGDSDNPLRISVAALGIEKTYRNSWRDRPPVQPSSSSNTMYWFAGAAALLIAGATVAWKLYKSSQGGKA